MQGQWAAAHLAGGRALSPQQAWVLKLKALALELAPRQAHCLLLEQVRLMESELEWKMREHGHWQRAHWRVAAQVALL